MALQEKTRIKKNYGIGKDQKDDQPYEIIGVKELHQPKVNKQLLRDKEGLPASSQEP